LLRHERLCSFNISSGNTLVQANLSPTLLRLVFTSTLL
ncbi:TPA: Hok/Gef family protein, partial [Proteus mirabilis]|nr:Hok/Gef family protein [Proteus mirabilis]HCZ8424883.1 Hok/Gef family protein [Proteus mirabilis]HCZ8610550.1 Hok/Gef family protein [Proteus mirabilis]